MAKDDEMPLQSFKILPRPAENYVVYDHKASSWA